MALSLHINSGVFGTDSLVDMTLLLALKVAQYIPTSNIHIVFPGHLVPEMFNPNRRISLSQRPQRLSVAAASS
jgi:hypothetical protein